MWYAQVPHHAHVSQGLKREDELTFIHGCVVCNKNPNNINNNNINNNINSTGDLVTTHVPAPHLPRVRQHGGVRVPARHLLGRSLYKDAEKDSRHTHNRQTNMNSPSTPPTDAVITWAHMKRT